MGDGVTVRETLAYYTFPPALVVGFGLPVLSFPAYLVGVAPFRVALALPWIGLAVICAWISLLGDATMPAETYRHRRKTDD